MPLRSLFLDGDASGGDASAPADGGATDGGPPAPADGDASGGDAPAPADGSPTGGDTAATGAALVAHIEELARDAAGAALAAGGSNPASDLAFTPDDASDKITGALKPGAVDAGKLDASTPAKQRALRDAINAEAELQAGTGISISAPDADGIRTIGAKNPTALAGGALGAADAYGQQPLVRTQKWKMEAIQFTEPHVIGLTWHPNPPTVPATYRGSAEIVPGVTATLAYIPLAESGQANRGKFTLAAKSPSTTPTMSTLFSGKTVQSLRLQLGADLAAAKAAQPFTVPVTAAAGVAGSLVMTANARRTADPTELAGGAAAVAIINFLFTSTVPGTGTVTGWTRDTAQDIPTESLPTNAEISGVTWDGASLWVLLAWGGSQARASTTARRAVAFTDGELDTTKGISHAALAAAFPGTAALPGIVWNGRSIVIRGDDGGAKAFTLTGGRYSVDDVPAGVFAASETGTSRFSGAVGLAWDGASYLYFDTDLHGLQNPDSRSQCFVRYVTGGARDTAKDIEITALTGGPALRAGLVMMNDLAVDARGHIYLLRDRGGLVKVADRAVSAAIPRSAFPHHASPALDRYQGLAIVGDTLYAGHRTPTNSVVVFTATVTGADHEAAYPPAEYDFRTIDQTEFRRLARGQYVKSVARDGGALTFEQVAEDGKPTKQSIEVHMLAVDRLPDPGTAGRQVWVKANYETRGVSVVPWDWGGPNGSRAWWYVPDGWHFGQILGVFYELFFVSDTTVMIRTGSIPGISKLHVGEDEYVLTAVAGKQNINWHGTGVDVYTITGGLPAGDWNEVWIEGATPEDRFPGSVTIKQGEYLDTGTAWVSAGFDALLAPVWLDFDVMIRAKWPGKARTKSVTFVEDTTHASLYVAPAPFDAITSITFDGRAGQSYQNRYVVRLAANLAVGDGIPAKLMVGVFEFELTEGTSEDGVAVFVTPVMGERVDDANLTHSLDLQYADGSWANGSRTKRIIQTLNQAALHDAASRVPEVKHVPVGTPDRRVRLVAPYTQIHWGAMEARATASGDFVGWYSGSPDVGSLSGAPGNGIAVFGSYLQSAGANLRNKTIWGRTSTTTKTPQYVWINGRRYGVTALGPSHPDLWSVNGADGSTVAAGQGYAVGFQWTDGSKVYPDTTFAPGDYTWAGGRWRPTPGVTVLPGDLQRASAALAGRRMVAVDRDTDRFKLIRGLTSLHDGAAVGINIRSTRAAQRGTFTLLAPAFDLDAVDNGVVWAEVEATVGTGASSTLGIGAEQGRTYRESNMVTVSALKRMGTYTTGGTAVQGAVAASMPVYNYIYNYVTYTGTNELLGYLRLYLGKNARSELGYVFDYSTALTNAPTQTLAVSCNLAFIYQPFL